MRIRFTLEVTRPPSRHRADPEQPPMVDQKGSFILERAEPQRIGFTTDTGIETEDHR